MSGSVRERFVGSASEELPGDGLLAAELRDCRGFLVRHTLAVFERAREKDALRTIVI
jgi:hypothetical protein